VSNYDLMVSDLKRATTAEILRLQRDKVDVDNIARLVDQLNEAWDKLTDALVRQRTERDNVVRDLIDQLAEARKER